MNLKNTYVAWIKHKDFFKLKLKFLMFKQNCLIKVNIPFVIKIARVFQEAPANQLNFLMNLQKLTFK